MAAAKVESRPRRVPRKPRQHGPPSSSVVSQARLNGPRRVGGSSWSPKAGCSQVTQPWPTNRRRLYRRPLTSKVIRAKVASRGLFSWAQHGPGRSRSSERWQLRWQEPRGGGCGSKYDWAGPREHTELGPRTVLMLGDTVGELSQIMPGNGATNTFQWSSKSAIPAIKLWR